MTPIHRLSTRQRLAWVVVVQFAPLFSGHFLFAQGAPSGDGSQRFDSGSDSAIEGGARANGVDIGLGGTNEPAVAVNPFNSQNVAMASLFQSRVSTNGGATWTAAQTAQVTAGYGLDGDSVLAFDSQGRLFWQYLGVNNSTARAEVFISQLNPSTGAFVAGPFRVTTSGAAGTGDNDKGWLAADRFASSPFRDRLYVAWSDFGSSPVRVLFSYSLNQGVTWSTPAQLSSAGDGGFPWPTHVAVASNGDVYVSFHDGSAGGSSGRVWVLRSTDGGLSFAQKNLAFTAGQADTTYNVQTSPGTIPGTQFWLQGSGQAWVVPDVSMPGNVYVVASDDPDNVHGSGDDSNIYIVRSTNNGASWNAPLRVDHGPSNTFAVMPTAAMDDAAGCIVVMWYDNRLGNLNGASHYFLDVYYSFSDDHGLTWRPDVRINDMPFDPDLGAPARFPGPPPTLRIGEYIGVTMSSGTVYGVWCGNSGGGQQTIFDSAVGQCFADCNHNGIADSVDISSGTSHDCDSDTIPDDCQVPPLCANCLDCNHDGFPDRCQVPPMCPGCPDCNANGVPDSCETDCNSNGRPDNCDIAGGFSQDCAPDNVPDECQVPPICALCTDCDQNGVPDFCDAVGHDCNGDLIPDRCQTDPLLCGGSCLTDCDHNFVPDSCQLVGAFSAQSPELAPIHGTSPQSYTLATPPVAIGDVMLEFRAVADLGSLTENIAININGTGVGTVFTNSFDCALDVETLVVAAATYNGIVNGGNAVIHMVPSVSVDAPSCPTSHISVKVDYAIASGDCNNNSILDTCEIAEGTLSDCNANGVPDGCDIASGALTDSDSNNLPDECECGFISCRGDLTLEFVVNGADVQYFLDCLVGGNLAAFPCACADMNGDLRLNSTDIPQFVSRLVLDPELNCH